MPEKLTREYLKSLLDYNPETGIFIVKKALPNRRQHRNRQAGNVAGTINDQGYRIITIDKQRYRAHQLAWLCVTGEFPDGHLDHKDGVRDNNAFGNLRKATQSQNAANMKIKSNNKTGLKGVSYFPAMKTRKWRSKIKINYEDIVLGWFDCPAAAHFSYIVAADKYHGEFARFA